MSIAITQEQPESAGLRPVSRVSATFRSPLGITALVGVILLIAIAVFGPMIWGAKAEAIDVNALGQGPSAQHLFGTDAGGRDMLARVLVATRLSVLMALAATAIGVTLGMLLGCAPTVLGRRWGRLTAGAVNLAVAFPGLLLAIFFSVIFGQSALGAVLAIGVAGAPSFARLTQTLSASVAGRDFFSAARILGVGRMKLLTRHVLPNIREQLIVVASLGAGGALIAFAGLSFLGLGVQAPSYDWGRLLNEGLSSIYVNPATALAPGGAVVLAGIIFVLFGESIARATGVERRALADALRRPQAATRRPRSEPADQGGTEADGVGTAAVLSVRNLRVAVPYGTGWRYAVDGVSFDIGRGEAVGVVGESGSGKSLTVNAVAGLLEDPLQVTADTLIFDDADLARDGTVRAGRTSRRSAAHLGTKLAMVFQDPVSSLNPALKVGTQVAEVGHLHQGLNRRAAWRRAVDRLRLVQISEPERRARQYPHEFSGGMRQRAMIAMGLMGRPALLIADEATSNLDVTVQREVLGLVHELVSEAGSALLMISHDLAVVTGICSRVLVMYSGHLVEDLDVADLLAGRARHPYTRALLASVPSMSSDRSLPLNTIAEGQQFPTEPVGASPVGGEGSDD